METQRPGRTTTSSWRRAERLSDRERRKLGPLGLRLVDRLTGPALQLAKQLGVSALAEETGQENFDAQERHADPEAEKLRKRERERAEQTQSR